eukprot:3404075-Amphidinium_carterae.3
MFGDGFLALCGSISLLFVACFWVLHRHVSLKLIGSAMPTSNRSQHKDKTKKLIIPLSTDMHMSLCSRQQLECLLHLLQTLCPTWTLGLQSSMVCWPNPGDIVILFTMLASSKPVFDMTLLESL